jgi:preprotein translocase subunit YajC
VNALLPLLLLPLCWLLLIRPQRQRVTRQLALVSALAVGDEVVTAAGIFGTVTATSPDRVSLEVAPGTVIDVVPAAVTSRAPAPTRAAGGAAA